MKIQFDKDAGVNMVRMKKMIVGAFFPQGTKRRVYIKLFFRFLCNPVRFIGKINKHNMQMFLFNMKSHDLVNLESKIDRHLYFMDVSSIRKIELQLVEAYEEILFPLFERPLVSIVVPVYDSWRYTYSCLKAIFEKNC